MIVEDGILGDMWIHLRWVVLPTTLKRLEAIPGVYRAALSSYNPYKLEIAFGKAFTWDEIFPHVEAILNSEDSP